MSFCCRGECSEVYTFSKLKKFMTTVNLMMESALRFLIQDSTRKYQHFLFHAAKYQVTVTSVGEVNVVAMAGEVDLLKYEEEDMVRTQP